MNEELNREPNSKKSGILSYAILILLMIISCIIAYYFLIVKFCSI